LFSRTESW